MTRGWAATLVGVSRTVAIAGVVLLIGVLPWLSGRSPEYTVLRARYADLEATPEALASVRAELGLDRGPVAVLLDWAAGLLRGDAGTSWVSGRPVLPGTLEALSVSLTLMGFAVVVAAVIAAALCLPTLRSGLRGRQVRGSGVLGASLTALPEFLLASALLIVCSVWLRWLPPYGWAGLEYAVLPALALGIPAGGLVGRLLSDAIASSFAERWVITWRMAGLSRRRVGAAVLRRALPSVLSQIGLVLIGLTGGAVAVEQVFAIPGLGRAILGAASTQDIPALQAGILALLAVAVVVGALVGLFRRLLLGSALRLGSLPVPDARVAPRPRDLLVPLVAAGSLAVIVAAGLLRDPFTSAHSRLEAPSRALPFGADASGRDLLGRVGHGALTTLGVALLVVLVCVVLGIAIGLFPHASTGPLEVANAAPPILAGIVVTALWGPSIEGAAVAVAAVSWAPLAAHTGSLVLEARAQPHIRILPVLGVGPVRTTLRYLVPAVVGPVLRHAMLRLPGIALTLAALGFLGLGSDQPTPEWGLILAEGSGYAERAPWVVLAPASVLVLAAVLAVSLASYDWSARPGLGRRASEPPGGRTQRVPAASSSRS
ncbi:ABC transporter permease subunit [Rathayibacter sp. VKM Ac-2803]|uniref:ABC transporter permease subunit n=1 Tax=unclassified Rathayibacter TaxID=2609250 RepID=UPI00135C6272|nr:MULTISPECIES: ABC transporter permease subunit [unclassified Rathayibacter]MWV48081.1 ABC transporter permease subunit [Rathayibacter sp. VKM Ac-2803]MWV58701.1 ABC transporter permease subunit [Rathayibacter sp. VKM Ac-2754]